MITSSPMQELISAIQNSFKFLNFLFFFFFTSKLIFFPASLHCPLFFLNRDSFLVRVSHSSAPVFLWRENAEKWIEAVFGSRIVEKKHQTIRLDAEKTWCWRSARMGSRSVSLSKKSAFWGFLADKYFFLEFVWEW